MFGLRQRLSLGFGGLLLIILIIGAQSILNLTKLGVSIDVILRENYQSVTACLQMKEALERIDKGLLFILLGNAQKGEELIRNNELAFEKALQAELNNVTLPGEGEKASRLRELYLQYRTALRSITDPGDSPARRDAYFAGLRPLFEQIQNAANDILHMNQENMRDANNEARRRAGTARRQMYILLVAGTIVSVGFMVFTGRWILRPIRRLIQSADEIRRGNLDLIVQGHSRDEIGRLSEAFNGMAASLREFRRTDQAKFIRVQRATQQAFDSLPDAIAVIDLEGKVEVATETARNVFGLKPGLRIHSLSSEWMINLYNDTIWHRPAPPSKSLQKPVQRFVRGEERYFRPEAVPILDDERQPAGVVLVLQDVTQLRQQDEIKRGVISTVSHQLKTPLTSIRMAIHLLLEEKVGPLTEKQAELVLAAREDSDRLHGILNNLLDISRIESGRAQMKFGPVSVRSLVMEAAEPFRRTAQDQGLSLDIQLPGDLPDVWADPAQIQHVFINLLTNALKHTPPGGRITLSAGTEEKGVRISISDTGRGIPQEYLPRIFEPFFRAPDQGAETGAGLGLAIVKEIVEAHGGSVGVESSEGKGSTFIFSLQKAGLGKEKESL